jgi:cytochrome P450
MVDVLRSVPTAPGRLPVVGHLPWLVGRPLRFVRSLQRRGDLVRIYFGERPVYVITGAAMLREVLVDSGRHVDKGSIFDEGKAFLGNGVVTSAGELHRRQRRLVQPAFHHDRIAEYAATMRTAANDVAAGWRAHEPIDVGEAMLRLASTVVTRTMFSATLASEVEDQIHRGLPPLIRGAMVRAFAPRLVDRLPASLTARYAAGATGVRSILEKLLSAGESDVGRGEDLVAVLRAARDRDTGMPMSEEQLRDELLNILIAGSETTGGAMGWMFHDLARHPAVERQVHDELDRVIGDRPVESDDIARLPYVRRVLCETLRLRGPWLSTRRALCPLRIGGIDVPAGTEFAFSLYAMHRDPQVFDDPDAFDVDRWLPRREAQRPRGSFIPFLDGNRKCLGDSFAWTEMVIVLATVARRWRLRIHPAARVREVPVATIRPGGLVMIPVPRPVRRARPGSSGHQPEQEVGL